MLENKIGMIFGVANKRSIAWACADALPPGMERGWHSPIRANGLKKMSRNWPAS